MAQSPTKPASGVDSSHISASSNGDLLHVVNKNKPTRPVVVTNHRHPSPSPSQDANPKDDDVPTKHHENCVTTTTVDEATSTITTIYRFRLVQLNDVYLLTNLPRLATYLRDHLRLPDHINITTTTTNDGSNNDDDDDGDDASSSSTKKNLPHTSTNTIHTTNQYGDITSTTITHVTTIITVSGDFLGPSLLSSLDGGSGMVDVLHALGVTHVSLGNHEDDIPAEALIRHIDGNKFEWVNTNLRTLDHALDVTTEECSFVEIGDMNDDGGTSGAKKNKKVALLGLLSVDRGLYRPNAFGGATTMVANGIRGMESPADAIERVVEENEAVRDADLIVPLTHLDMADDIQLAEKFGGSDEKGDDDANGRREGGLFPVIIGGHDHDVIDEVHNGCRILKSGSDAHRAAVVEYMWRESSDDDTSTKQTPEVSVQWIDAEHYEPHPAVQNLVDDRRRILQELETARLFRISEMLDAMRQWGVDVLRPEEEGRREFSTKRNRYRTTGASSAFCGAIRKGCNADCCIINAGGIRGDTDYEEEEDGDDGKGWFTFADLKSEMPFQDAMGVVPMPGRVLEGAVGYSRRASRRDPPEEDSGLLHLCDMVRYTYKSAEDEDGWIVEIGGLPFAPGQIYSVALPIALLNGMDDNVPLLDWARESGLRMSEEGGKPVKIIFVETFALSFWGNLGSFAEMDEDGDGIITRVELERAISTKLGLDYNSEKDSRYLKFLVDDIMAVADVDGSGTVDLTEFLAAKLNAGIQEVAPRERMTRESLRRPSIFLQRMARRELGRNARETLVQRTVQSVKNVLQRRDTSEMDGVPNSDEANEGDVLWYANLSDPHLDLPSNAILE